MATASGKGEERLFFLVSFLGIRRERIVVKRGGEAAGFVFLWAAESLKTKGWPFLWFFSCFKRV